jgi:hypothetical protein
VSSPRKINIKGKKIPKVVSQTKLYHFTLGTFYRFGFLLSGIYMFTKTTPIVGRVLQTSLKLVNYIGGYEEMRPPESKKKKNEKLTHTPCPELNFNSNYHTKARFNL